MGKTLAVSRQSTQATLRSPEVIKVRLFKPCSDNGAINRAPAYSITSQNNCACTGAINRAMCRFDATFTSPTPLSFYSPV
ncbi:MAG: hypothetical protein LBG92_03830, partial [Prevotellaceae bacterium]|nr:hypothetical protein [Prevotellaceae bacterium]